METEVHNDLERTIGELNGLSERLYAIRYRTWSSTNGGTHTGWTNTKRDDARELLLPIVAALEELHGMIVSDKLHLYTGMPNRERYERAWVMGLKLLAQIDGPETRRMYKLFKRNDPSKAARRRARLGYLVGRMSFFMNDNS